MTNVKSPRPRRLSLQILGIIGISAVVAAGLFFILRRLAGALVETYCFHNDIPMDEFAWLQVDSWVFSAAMAVSVGFFALLFLGLLTDRLQYIHKLTNGIHSIRTGDFSSIEKEGNNELTELACAINEMHACQQQLRQKEQALALEKEQFIRTMSHDIRTPLTSILAYSDYLCRQPVPEQEQKAHLELIRKKALQIRDLTDVLLDGNKRSAEHFDNARLLLEQLCDAFEEELEDGFAVQTDLSGCPVFSAAFDVRELQRIFDNLVSNVRKYAEPEKPVSLSVSLQKGKLRIRQSNTISLQRENSESYRLGLHSIRRIAQFYGGQVETGTENGVFWIEIVLSEF